ncbi:MAG: hypothetical protein U5L04_00650 [Trueperaceae bacterium]|nr:hypothetical protein [Trueperaceae bacterium]
MSDDFKYSLTRICLRSGQFTLSRKLTELFPDTGLLTALDTVRNTEIELAMLSPRVVTGLADFLGSHELNVNDEVQIRLLDDGRYALTPLYHARKPNYQREETVAALLDRLTELAPLSEAEIRDLFPDLPKTAAVEEWLEHDDRFVKHSGRWHHTSPDDSTDIFLDDEVSGSVADERDTDRNTDRDDLFADAVVAHTRPETSSATPSATSSATSGTARRPNAHRSSFSDASQNGPADTAPDTLVADADVAGADIVSPVRISSEPFTSHYPPPNPSGSEPSGDRSEQRNVIRDSAVRQPVRPPARQPGRGVYRATVTSYPQYSVTPRDAAIPLGHEQSPQDYLLHGRARDVLGSFGYRLEVLSPGNLIAHADLGRYRYSVFVYLLPDKGRVDWARLLSQRRERGTTYLAVFGAHHDLLKLGSPADMANATLWSWQGLERVRSLATTVPVSPIDLEPHFKRDGLIEQSIPRFERVIEQRIAERGTFSAVLTRLASFKAPSIFLLDDVMADVDMPRDQVLSVLMLLAQAPFHLVSKIDDGEFCLRYGVAPALLHLSDYALSLRERLPARTPERLRGHGDSGELNTSEFAIVSGADEERDLA